MTRGGVTRRFEWMAIGSTNIVIVGLGALTSIVLSRSLGPSARGEYVSWQVWVTTAATMATLGLPQGIVTLPSLPRRVTLGAIRPALGLSLGLGLTTSTIALVLLGAPPVAMLAGLFQAAVTVLTGVLAAAAQRAGSLGAEFNLIRVGPLVAGIAGALVALWIFGKNASEVFLLTSGAQLLFVTVTGLTLARLHPNTPAQPWRPLVRESVRMTPISWVSLLQYRADLLMVSILFPSAATAFYAIGSSSQSAVFAAGQSTGMQWFAHGRTMSLKRAVAGTVLICTIAALPFIAFSPWLVDLLYGPSFRAAAPPMVFLTIAALPQALDYLFTHAAMFRRTHTQAFGVKVLALGLLAGSIALAWYLGLNVTGAAILACIATSISVVPLVVTLKRAQARA